MFTTLILIVHIVVCIALILIILLQSGKGADIGAVFGGGGSQTVFGSTGATPFLSKITIGAAVVFMITSIILTYFSGRVGSVAEKSIMSEQATTEMPKTPPMQPSGGTEAPKTEAPKTESAPAKPEGAQQPAAVPPASPAPASEKVPENK
ncbi:MAG TPA: preprotein translocase subunit SecG [Desulfomonilaceae bacterium]|nr:preprotein translocase subunit SecG [Desulfomonilaceae bacterium]